MNNFADNINKIFLDTDIAIFLLKKETISATETEDKLLKESGETAKVNGKFEAFICVVKGIIRMVGILSILSDV